MNDHQAVNTDYWVVLADTEREQWGYVPRQTLGPLSFGTERHEAITAMAKHGFSAAESEIERWNPQRAQWRVEFRRAESDDRRPAVKCYFVEGVGLTCAKPLHRRARSELRVQHSKRRRSVAPLHGGRWDMVHVPAAQLD